MSEQFFRLSFFSTRNKKSAASQQLFHPFEQFDCAWVSLGGCLIATKTVFALLFRFFLFFSLIHSLTMWIQCVSSSTATRNHRLGEAKLSARNRKRIRVSVCSLDPKRKKKKASLAICIIWNGTRNTSTTGLKTLFQISATMHFYSLVLASAVKNRWDEKNREKVPRIGK